MGRKVPMTALGAVFRPQLPPERLRDIARLADGSGLEELWLWEDCFREGGISTAAAALAWTERVKVGVGLLPVPLRNVAITAMEVASLNRMFPGRAVVGVGHGVQDWMGQVGARVESPVSLLREHLVALRALLRGSGSAPTGGTSISTTLRSTGYPTPRPRPRRRHRPPYPPAHRRSRRRNHPHRVHHRRRSTTRAATHRRGAAVRRAR